MMRKLTLSLLLIAMAFSNFGCVLVVGVDDFPGRKHIVELNGRTYVVDTKTHRLQVIEFDEDDDAAEPAEHGDDD